MIYALGLFSWDGWTWWMLVLLYIFAFTAPAVAKHWWRSRRRR